MRTLKKHGQDQIVLEPGDCVWVGEPYGERSIAITASVRAGDLSAVRQTETFVMLRGTGSVSLLVKPCLSNVVEVHADSWVTDPEAQR